MQFGKMTARVTMTVGAMLTMSAVLAAPFVSAKGYSLNPASGWQLNKSGMMGTDVLVIAPPANGFAANLNVIVRPAAGASLDAAAKEMAGAYGRAFTGYKPISQSFGTQDGVRTLRVMGTYTRDGKRLRIRQVVALKNSMAYTFTCTSVEATHAKYDPAFDKMLASIHWKK